MTNKDFNQISSYLTYLLILARSFLLLAFVSKYSWIKLSRPHKYLFIYSIIALCSAVFEASFVVLVNQFKDFFVPILKKIEIDDTFFISPIYYLNEFLFVGLAFTFASNTKYKSILLTFTIFSVFSEAVNTFWIEGFRDSQTFGSLGLSIFNIFISLWYIKDFLKIKSKQSGLKDSFFIISLSILIPYTFSIIFYGTTKSLFEEDYIMFQKLQFFRIMLESLCLFLMAYGVSLVRKSLKIKI